MSEMPIAVTETRLWLALAALAIAALLVAWLALDTTAKAG